MRALTLTAAALAFALAAGPSPAFAKPSLPPPGHAKGAVAELASHSPAERKHRRFSDQDDVAVRSFFSGQPHSWASLPPGIAKAYARGKPLPPGIATKYLPLSLEWQLPDFPRARYYLVGRDLVLVDTTTRIVIDILKDVLG